MRQIRITTHKRQMEAADDTMLYCPVMSNVKTGYIVYCTDKCAWFRIENSKDNLKDIKIAFCGDKLIGEIRQEKQNG